MKKFVAILVLVTVMMVGVSAYAMTLDECFAIVENIEIVACIQLDHSATEWWSFNDDRHHEAMAHYDDFYDGDSSVQCDIYIGGDDEGEIVWKITANNQIEYNIEMIFVTSMVFNGWL